MFVVLEQGVYNISKQVWGGTLLHFCLLRFCRVDLFPRISWRVLHMRGRGPFVIFSGAEWGVFAVLRGKHSREMISLRFTWQLLTSDKSDGIAAVLPGNSSREMGAIRQGWWVRLSISIYLRSVVLWWGNRCLFRHGPVTGRQSSWQPILWLWNLSPNKPPLGWFRGIYWKFSVPSFRTLGQEEKRWMPKRAIASYPHHRQASTSPLLSSPGNPGQTQSRCSNNTNFTGRLCATLLWNRHSPHHRSEVWTYCDDTNLAATRQKEGRNHWRVSNCPPLPPTTGKNNKQGLKKKSRQGWWATTVIVGVPYPGGGWKIFLKSLTRWKIKVPGG